MVEVGFYQLQRSALEPALGRLLEKVLASGQRAVVRAASPDRVEALNRVLWILGHDSFLPHGSRDDGFAEDQPVFLTASADYPNGATVLVLVDGAEAEPASPFERYLYLFDGHDEQAVEEARARWRQWRERGAKVTYWQQTERGGWQQAGTRADDA
jgi:DNA polymerase III subunit chi